MQRESLTGGLAALIGDIIVGIEHRFQPFMHTAHQAIHIPARVIWPSTAVLLTLGRGGSAGN